MQSSLRAKENKIQHYTASSEFISKELLLFDECRNKTTITRHYKELPHRLNDKITGEYAIYKRNKIICTNFGIMQFEPLTIFHGSISTRIKWVDGMIDFFVEYMYLHESINKHEIERLISEITHVNELIIKYNYAVNKLLQSIDSQQFDD